MSALSAVSARWPAFLGNSTIASSKWIGSVRDAPRMVATRCPSSTTSRADPVSGISCAICLSVQPSVAPSPEGCGIVATMPRTLRHEEPVQPPPSTLGLDGSDAHAEATLDLAEQPGGELLMRRVLFLDQFQHLIVDVGQQLQELAVIHSPPPGRARDRSKPVGQIVDGPGQQKKRPTGRFSVVPSRSDVVVFDLGHVGGVMVARARGGYITDIISHVSTMTRNLVTNGANG